MLTTINKHRQVHHRASGRHFHIADSRFCSTWATYHPNPPKDTLLFLLSMVPLYSRLTPKRLPLPPHCLSCIVPLCLCFSISQSLFVSSFSRVHLSLSLSEMISFSTLFLMLCICVWQFGVLAPAKSFPLTSAHNSTHVKSRREEGGGGREMGLNEVFIYLFLKSHSL